MVRVYDCVVEPVCVNVTQYVPAFGVLIFQKTLPVEFGFSDFDFTGPLSFEIVMTTGKSGFQPRALKVIFSPCLAVPGPLIWFVVFVILVLYVSLFLQEIVLAISGRVPVFAPMSS